MCISSVQESNGNSIEFFLSTRSVIKSSQAKLLQLAISAKNVDVWRSRSVQENKEVESKRQQDSKSSRRNEMSRDENAEEWEIAARKWINTKRQEGVCAKEWEVKGRGDLVSQTSFRP